MNYEQAPNRHVAQYADLYDAHDQKVIESGKKISVLSIDIMSQVKPIVMLGCKVPLIDDEEEIQGILGQALLLDAACVDILYKLIQIKNHNLTNATYEIHDYSDFGLSTRESECYFYLLRGYTAKAIGLKLAISHKTVEFYLTEVKRKLHCHTKTQLIEKGFDLGLIHIIPNKLIPSLQLL